jgi:glycine cleavage system protein P-like pyridoxal-binding family
LFVHSDLAGEICLAFKGGRRRKRKFPPGNAQVKERQVAGEPRSARVYLDMRTLGRDGMARVGEFATLDANYSVRTGCSLRTRLFHPTDEPRVHPDLAARSEGVDVTAMDIAKRWLDDVRAAKHLDLSWKPVQ